jgi:endonuclease/exonuclease/phosphatase family metal-dependent hydrolase
MKATSSSKDYITHFTKTIKGIHKSATIRAREAEQIKKLSEKMGSRIVVAGDFNDLPLSWSYKILTTTLLDTFFHSGAGWGATFKHLGKLLRLDYILISRDTLSADYFDILKSGASDHYPILARIGLNESMN